MGIWVAISPHDVRERRVPSLGGYDHHHRRSHNDIITLFIGCFSGMVIGGMHCLGWNVLFHGHAGQILWRAASLAIVCTPVSIFLVFSCGIWLNGQTTMHLVHVVVGIAVLVTAFTSIVIYIIARGTLLVLILLSFLSLPSGVYDTVAWTNFIPYL
ncbi:hypothetical protein EDB19DRAFT_709255 [Suillus lakei]|nr:hypothetical protein EDB19DRAFT_709255 [Suillus lakei]